MSDPYAITPDLLNAYQAKYGTLPSAGAQAIYNQENTLYTPGSATATGSVAGSGIPGSSNVTPAGSSQSWGNVFSNAFSNAIGNVANPLGTVENLAGSGLSALGNAIPGAQTLTGIQSFFSVIGDIPRVTTIILGIVILFIGISALIAEDVIGGAVGKVVKSVARA